MKRNKRLFTKKNPQLRIRRRILIGFFIAILLFAAVVFAICNYLEMNGISVEFIRGHSLRMLLLSALCATFVSAASYLMLRKTCRSLEDMNQAALKIAKGDYDIHLTYSGHVAELANTVQNFNKMAQELRSVEMIRKDFIANVSHEFKTPLSSVAGYVTLLQDPELTEEERNEYIQKAFFNIEKLNDLTENILRLSKLENQTYLDPPVSYRLDEQIREAIVLLEQKWSKKQIELELDLPETVYFGQRALLFQVWVNLISNAIKFSDPGGSISVRLKVRAQDIQVFVSDEGIGMEPETMEHIFDKFYQGDTSRRAQGNGLGLALCKEILQRCDGKIFVTSEPGTGSVFMVQLSKNLSV